jgi:hypothetical protein
MAGIFERVKSTATDRVPSHQLDSAFVFKELAIFTNQQLLDDINRVATANNHPERALTAAEITDLQNIAAALAAAGSVNARHIYFQRLRAAFYAAEIGSITEAQFRSILGIA